MYAADDGAYEVIQDTADSLELCFSMETKKARILWAKDLDRQGIRDVAGLQQDHPELEPVLSVIRSNWQQAWNNGRYDIDYFRSYLIDSSTPESVWKMLEDDLFIVLDQNRRLVFVNCENLIQSLYGNEVFDKFIRAIDLMKFYTAIPRPETKRHAIDRYILQKHPELVPGLATIQTLPNAKMGVAHYGCWSMKGDWHSRNIWRTKDTGVRQSFEGELWCLKMMPQFMCAVFGTASDLIRSLMQPLAPDHYKECLEIFAELPDSAKVVTNEQDFCSLFALDVNAHTQRHRDTGDFQGGLAGLVSLGNYTDKNSSISRINPHNLHGRAFPFALGVKVPYRPGACALLRGGGLEHLVTDFQGPRFFVVATNHETSKKYAWRAKGRLPPLPPKPDRRRRTSNSTDEEAPGPWMPCINKGTDDDDEDQIRWTNSALHGPRALVSSSESGSAA
ncbi:hypothetical protein PG994_010331 [Apiospora phragmitis]|uniref:Uncharacterized protein n=1 Tax=Apiospora phragmitis TaxID=2905665 RepID=A0ABR1TPN1_9PEZI